MNKSTRAIVVDACLRVYVLGSGALATTQATAPHLLNESWLPIEATYDNEATLRETLRQVSRDIRLVAADPYGAVNQVINDGNDVLAALLLRPQCAGLVIAQAGTELVRLTRHAATSLQHPTTVYISMDDVAKQVAVCSRVIDSTRADAATSWCWSAACVAGLMAVGYAVWTGRLSAATLQIVWPKW